MTRILDGKSMAAEIRREVAAGVGRLVRSGGRAPGLAAVVVGEDPASKLYVQSKSRASSEVGFTSRVIELPAAVSESEFLARIDDLNHDPRIDGILIQLPLPAGLREATVLERVDPAKDVDGFHPINVGRLWLDQEGFVPATPSGIVELLRRSGIDLVGRRAVIVGRSHIVGKPLAGLLLREHCTVTVAHSRTRDLDAICRGADLLVAAIGRPAFFGPEHVAEGAVVIDVGIHRITDRREAQRLFRSDPERLDRFDRTGGLLVGDVDFDRVAPRAAAITPVPGGVGPLTVAYLLVNTLKAAGLLQGLDPHPR